MSKEEYSTIINEIENFPQGVISYKKRIEKSMHIINGEKMVNNVLEELKMMSWNF